MPEDSTSSQGDFGGRRPSAHERMAGVPWDASYGNGPAPWDLGGPQPAIVRLAAGGGFRSPMLDAGCGTGENAFLFAAQGVRVLGVDVAPTAVAIARAAAAERGLDVDFAVADAFALAKLGRSFATVLDSGLLHTFDAEERRRYARSLASATVRGGMLHLLCFSDDGVELGPHPLGRADVEAAFGPADGWKIVTIEPERVHTRFHGDGGVAGWIAAIERL